MTGAAKALRGVAGWLRDLGEVVFASFLALGLLLLLPVLLVYLRARPEVVPQESPAGFQH